jgi:predicted nucleic acid-binding protein
MGTPAASDSLSSKTMKYLLDTDILIDILRGYLPSVEWFATLTERPAVISVGVMELIQGCRSKRDLALVQQLIAPMEIWYPTSEEMRAALEIFTVHFLTNRMSVIDAIVGAVAASRSTPLCSFNTRHYQVVQGLELCQPYSKSV